MMHSGETIQQLTGLVDELTYRNYAHNRAISPDVSAERWRELYGLAVDAMEERFRQEGV